MTTAFQTVFDRAETIAFNRKKTISQTQARDGTVKSVSLGGQLWRFEVALPNGPKWTEYRGLIEKMEALDRITAGTVQINHSGLSWLTGYQGNLTDISAVTVSFTSGNTVSITGGATLSTGFRFRSGDLIQLGTGSVYSVVNDVAFNQTTVTLHRPVREAAGNYTLKIGANVTWSVICTQFPQWTIMARDQISWSGPFVFVEAV